MAKKSEEKESKSIALCTPIDEELTPLLEPLNLCYDLIGCVGIVRIAPAQECRNAKEAARLRLLLGAELLHPFQLHTDGTYLLAILLVFKTKLSAEASPNFNDSGKENEGNETGTKV